MAYPTVDDFRTMGIDEADYDDDAVEAALAYAIQFIHRATGQFFVEREADVSFDGNDGDTLFLPVPLIELEALYLNGATTPTDSGVYRAYTRCEEPQDDRRNPKIQLVDPSSTGGDIFSAPIITGALKFRKGRQNQRVVGTFGFVEADGSTPAMITRAIKKLTIEKLAPLVTTADTPSAPELPALIQQIAEEQTDGHRVKFAIADRSGRRVGLSGVTPDPEIEDIVRLYKSPIKLGAPNSWTWN